MTLWQNLSWVLPAVVCENLTIDLLFSSEVLAWTLKNWVLSGSLTGSVGY